MDSHKTEFALEVMKINDKTIIFMASVLIYGSVLAAD